MWLGVLLGGAVAIIVVAGVISYIADPHSSNGDATKPTAQFCRDFRSEWDPIDNGYRIAVSASHHIYPTAGDESVLTSASAEAKTLATEAPTVVIEDESLKQQISDLAIFIADAKRVTSSTAADRLAEHAPDVTHSPDIIEIHVDPGYGLPGVCADN